MCQETHSRSCSLARTHSPSLNLRNSKFNYLACFLFGTSIVRCDYTLKLCVCGCIVVTVGVLFDTKSMNSVQSLKRIHETHAVKRA